MRGKSNLLSATAILVVLALCGSTLVAGVNDGLISHWKFDEGSGSAAYDSAGNNDGTIHGAAWMAGYLGGALDFDGVDNYVDMKYPGPLGNSPRTITAWAKTSSNSKQIILSYGGSSGNRGSTIRAGLSAYGCQGVTFDISFGVVTYSATVADGQWHHYAYIIPDKADAAIGDVELYQDGVLLDNICASAHSSLINTLSTRAIDIGRYTSDQTQYFNGCIDDVRVYDRALSAVEIQQLYQCEFPDVAGLEITGPGEVAENFSAGYKAIAYYDDDSTRDVTKLADWSVEPEAIASIEKGVLTTKDIIKDESATIRATYTEGDITFEAEKMVDIFAICPTGIALQFDGVDDYVEIGDKLNDIDSPFSIVAWVNKRGEGSHPIFTSDNFGSGNYYGLWLYIQNDNTLQISYGDGSGNGSTARRTKVSSSSVQNNKWTFIAAVVRGAVDMDLYIDGLDVGGSYSGSGGDIVHSTHKAVIGLLRTSVAYYFNGLIDEVAIYNRALSVEEIWASMHRRLSGDDPGLVAYWDFDEGMGQIVYDLSGNGNDGQLGSTPDVDAGDPAWVESDAPIGRCNPYLIATAAAKKALKHKRASLKELQAALAEEWKMYEALEQWLESGDFVDLSKGDIVKARQKTHSAMQHEEQSIDMLGKGFENLLYSLSLLGYGPQPPGSNWPPNVTITKPQNGAEFNPDQTIVIEADAWDYDGSVVMVEFFADGSKIGEDTDGSDGWTTSWSDHPEGTYSLTATATDNEGAVTTSASVGISVAEEPPPPPGPGPGPPLPPPT